MRAGKKTPLLDKPVARAPAVKAPAPGRIKRKLSLGLAATLLLLVGVAGPARAGEAVVTAANAVRTGGTWTFDVTVQHADEGWEHYADSWRVSGPDGTVYGVRQLFHPHVGEQPFTRSLTGVTIPAGVRRVTIQAHDLVHGWGKPFTLDLPG